MSGTAPSQFDPAARAEVLAEALPYIRRFWGKVVVVKHGGHALSTRTPVPSAGASAGEPVEPSLASFAQDIVLMSSVVGVHGNAGQTNYAAVGLSGEDAGLITASAHPDELGFVGEVKAVNPTILERLLAQDLIPVVATIGSDPSGQAYNINADTAAGAVAEVLGAEKLVYLTNVGGLRRRVDDPSSLVHATNGDELEAMMADGVLSDGMIPKAAACVRAVRSGVGQAHILDGRLPHALLLEVYTREGVGTLVSP